MPSIPAASPSQAAVVRIPSRATRDAGRLLTDLGEIGVGCEGAIDQIIFAIENGERVPREYVHAAAERMICRDLEPERARRLAGALSHVADHDLTVALVGILRAERVEGDELLIECALRVLRGTAHRRCLTLTQRRLANAQALGWTRTAGATVIQMHLWISRRHKHC